EITVSADGTLRLDNGSDISGKTNADGNTGNLIIIAGNIQIEEGSSIANLAQSGATGNAGNIHIQTDELSIRGSNDQIAGIINQTQPGSSGNAGFVEVTVIGLLEMLNGASIGSGTFSEGDAGSVTIRAGELRMDGQGSGNVTGILSQAESGSVGDAGSVDVTVTGRLEMLNLSRISSGTFSDGNAGSVTIRTGELRMDGQGSEYGTGIASDAYSGSGNGGSVDVTVSGLMEMLNLSRISSGTLSDGNAGNVTIKAGELRMDSQESEYVTGIASDAYSGSGNGGSVDVTVTGRLEMLNLSRISSGTFSDGNAGSVTIRTGELRMDGQGSESATGIASDAGSGSYGYAGSVDVTVTGRLEMLNLSRISSGTFSDGNAGSVTIRTGELRMDGQGSEYGTGIASDAYSGSGNGSSVDVTVTGLLEMLNLSQISSSTFSEGNAGNVTIRAGELRMDSQGAEHAAGIFSNADLESCGDASSVDVTVNGLLEILNGAAISSSTFSEGDAGSVTIRAGELRMDDQGSEYGTGIASEANSGSGNGGSVDVTVNGLLEMSNGAGISSNTVSQGKAGSVIVHANRIRMEGVSYISSAAGSYSFGNAGTVNITVDSLLEMVNGAQITSSAYALSFGNAGNVIIKAGEIIIDGSDSESFTGISSLVGELALGHVGNVDISAGTVTVKNGGEISIAANQTLWGDRLTDIPDSSIHIDTDSLHLDRNSRITAESTGNVPAASIHIQTGDLFIENSSRITTSSNEADGGPISIQGETLILRDGLITTSVEGEAGNGGNITVSGMTSGPADVLVFDGGFIQANTAAENARGGDIFIDAKTVIANNDSLEVGGTERQIFEPGSGQNIIQAAAPGGEQGTINITAPNLNISGSLINISSGFAAPVTPSEDPCRAAAGKNPSSLVLKGRGGLPPDPDHLSVPFFGKERLDRLREPENRKEE
ncbi:MAG: beta strand repeat-containing protein, partial [Desulfococcaceae bacterium]